MRVVSVALLLLPLLVAAQDQKPLGGLFQGWLNKAKTLIPSAPVPSEPAPAEEEVVPEVVIKDVLPVTLDNWRTLLSPAAGADPEAWMVFVTGGNKTCYGRCGATEKAWNDSVPLLSADPSCPNLGLLNCESQSRLCSTWYIGPPTIIYFEPVVEEANTRTLIRFQYLNVTNTTATQISTSFTDGLYKNIPPYDGLFHPFDGFLAKNGLLDYAGWVVYGFGLVPSWGVMVILSFLSRTMMSRRMNPNRR